MRGIVVSFVSPTTKRAGRRNRRRHQAPKKSLRLPKSKLGNSGNDLLHRPMTPRPVQRGGGVKVSGVQSSPKNISASRESRLRRSTFHGLRLRAKFDLKV